MNEKAFAVADLFCGAGGSSTGAEKACAEMGATLNLVAVNHWPVAIETHSRNHPTARHYVEDVNSADPEMIVKGGYLDLLMASPECRFFSRARGGKPVNAQNRMSAWAINRWATALHIRCILVENVPEFVDWGPLVAHPKRADWLVPDPARKGQYFEAWTASLRAMGYQLDYRVLNAADYGEATTRKRFFLIARRDGAPIVWPAASHSQAGGNGLKRWRAAREILDLDKPGRSLFDRKKPLSENTRRRIARGLQRFGGPLWPRYVALLDLPEGVAPAGGADEASLKPLPTIAQDGAISLVDAVLTCYYGQSDASSVDAPVPTITGKDRFGMVSALAVPCGPRAEARPVEEPLPTIMTRDRLAVAVPTAEPFVMANRSDNRPRDIAEPLPTITSVRGWNVGLVEPTAEPFIVPGFGERAGQLPRVLDVAEPLPTIAGQGHNHLVTPCLIQTDQAGAAWPAVRDLDTPLPTLVTKQNLALVEPVLHAATEEGIDLRRLVFIDGIPYVLDIRYRMLANAELARGMGFDDEEVHYEFVGTGEQITKQIGNAVSVRTARALVLAILGSR